jgi:hypothetical protein
MIVDDLSVLKFFIGPDNHRLTLALAATDRLEPASSQVTTIIQEHHIVRLAESDAGVARV